MSEILFFIFASCEPLNVMFTQRDYYFISMHNTMDSLPLLVHTCTCALIAVFKFCSTHADMVRSLCSTDSLLKSTTLIWISEVHIGAHYTRVWISVNSQIPDLDLCKTLYTDK